jgi:hypothetical protein
MNTATSGHKSNSEIVPKETRTNPSDSGGKRSNQTLEIVELAKLGMDAIAELRDVLRAVQRIAEASGDAAILGITRIGIRIADDSHNMLDCEREGVA